MGYTHLFLNQHTSDSVLAEMAQAKPALTPGRN